MSARLSREAEEAIEQAVVELNTILQAHRDATEIEVVDGPERMEPIILDEHGRPRFRANAIVRYLLDAPEGGENEAEWAEINLNDRVRVKLNDEGVALAGGLLGTPDADGYVETQWHCLANVLGPHLSIGIHPPCLMDVQSRIRSLSRGVTA